MGKVLMSGIVPKLTAPVAAYKINVDNTDGGVVTIATYADSGVSVPFTVAAPPGHTYNGATLTYGITTISLAADESSFTMPAASVMLTPIFELSNKSTLRYVWEKFNCIYARSESTSNTLYITALSSEQTIYLYTWTSEPAFDAASGKYSVPSNSTKTTINLGDNVTLQSGDYYVYTTSPYNVTSSTVVHQIHAKKTFVYVYDDTYDLTTNDGKSVSVTRLGSNLSKGSTSYGHASNSASSKYPSDGDSGDFWYVKKGSDTIDPSAVNYSSDVPAPGDTIAITVTPRSNTYGGTISYLYQYSTDNGASWTTITTTTATTASVTIPADAKQFSVRVRASDNYGYTSSNYVYGEAFGFSDTTIPFV